MLFPTSVSRHLTSHPHKQTTQGHQVTLFKDIRFGFKYLSQILFIKWKGDLSDEPYKVEGVASLNIRWESGMGWNFSEWKSAGILRGVSLSVEKSFRVYPSSRPLNRQWLVAHQVLLREKLF